jgi:ribosomal protein L37AE/L43A
MSVLMCREEGALERRVEFERELRIGSDAGRDGLVLSEALGVAAEHAVITRAVIGKLLVLVDLTGVGLRVNRQRVTTLRVLHHGDIIEVGRVQLVLREIQIRRLAAAKGRYKLCVPCSDDLRPGEEVVFCPNCAVPHHRHCWFSIPICSTDGCQYPIRETAIKALSPPCAFLVNLEQGAKLIAEKRKCDAGTRLDVVAFQEGDDVALCPSCEAPFHLRCWLGLERCTLCSYEVRALLDRVFDAESSAETG